MNKKYKPFRLLNQLELKKLEQHFRTVLRSWNKQYAFLPLSCSLSTVGWALAQHDDSNILLALEEQPLALVSALNVPVMSLCLFGEICSGFNAAIEIQMIQLMGQLLELSSLELHPLNDHSFRKEEWFYYGAPTIELQFRVEHPSSSHSFIVYVHPLWILKFLPQPLSYNKPKTQLHEALGGQNIACQVELQTFKLKVRDSINLQVGDVIKTDHMLTTPLLLKHHQQTLCKVNLGKSNIHQSIQIVSSI